MLNKKRGLVLSGGGCATIFQVKVIEDIIKQNNGINPYDYVVGTSGGALNAVGFVQGGIEQLKYWWSLVTENKDIWTPKFLNFFGLAWRTSARDTLPLKNLIANTINLDTLKKSKTEVEVCSVNLSNGDAVFSNPKQENFKEYLLASCSVPGFFPPVIINGEPHIDGAIREGIPMLRAVESDCTEIDVITVSPKDNRVDYLNNDELNTGVKILYRVLDLFLEEALVNDLGGYNKNINIYAPKEKLLDDSFGSPLDFEKERMQEIYSKGADIIPITLDEYLNE